MYTPVNGTGVPDLMVSKLSYYYYYYHCGYNTTSPITVATAPHHPSLWLQHRIPITVATSTHSGYPLALRALWTCASSDFLSSAVVSDIPLCHVGEGA